jgi:hypothetical protein
LLPAVREAAKDTLIIADGFNCREQVSELTDRHPLHLAQVIQMAMREGTSGASDVYPYRTGDYPESRYLQHGIQDHLAQGTWLVRNRGTAAAGATLAGAALAGGAMLWRRRRK